MARDRVDVSQNPIREMHDGNDEEACDQGHNAGEEVPRHKEGFKSMVEAITANNYW
ncbi:MAG: hypothetical protein KDA96_07425 [Planctomycetaceae bacterium]|nr:hypothetical protein [Planctomycetaceae bacterium]